MTPHVRRQTAHRAFVGAVSWAALLLAGLPAVQAERLPPPQGPAPLRVAVLAVATPAAEQAQWQPLAQYLSQALAGPVTLRVQTRAQIDAALAQQQLDLVITHPGHAVELQQARVVGNPIATRLVRDPQAGPGTEALGAFGGVIFALESPQAPRTLADLRQARVAAPDTHWLGAYQMQSHEMLQQGLEPPHGARLLQVGGNQWAVVEAVLSGRAAAGFVRTGVLEAMAAEGRVELKRLRVLAAKQWPRFPYRVSTRLVPEWPAVLNPALGAAQGARIGAALLALPAHAVPQLPGFTIPADYSEVTEVLKANRAAPFENVSQTLLQELWSRQQGAILALLAAAALVMMAGGTLLWEHRRLKRAYRRVGMLADASRDAVFSLDPQGGLKLWGQAADRLFGARLTQARGEPFAPHLLAPACRPTWQRLQQTLRAQATAGAELASEVRALDAAGQPFPAELTLKLVEPTPTRHQTAWLAFLRDLRPERNSQLRTRLMASVFTHAREGITITDPTGRILEVNEAFSAVTGYSRAEVLGHNPRILQSGRQTPEFYAAMWAALRAQGHWSGEIWNRRKSGQIYPEFLSISAVHDSAGELQHYVALFSDISEMKDQQHRLEQVAHFDTLTGLPNRTLLADRLQQAAANAHRRHHCVAAVHLDIDQFTQINERLGQPVGDALLSQLAQRLRHALREGDTVARVGGDEFALLLCDLASPEAAREGVTRLQQLISQPFQLSAHALVSITTSLGVALFPDDSANPERVLRGAEQASYRAKQLGRNGLCFFDAAHDAAVKERNALLEALRLALKAEQFVLHYQPKVDMRSGRVIGLEALIRWQHPQRGLVPPAEFLPVLEDDALGLAVGDWVLRTALRQQAAWVMAGQALPVSVNIAAPHLQAPGFVARLAELLDQHPGVAPALLQLEILETSALEDLQSVRQVLLEADALGLQFALDDFGTGYSSLAYLKNLPVRTLKIDQAFVRGMDRDPGDRAIVQAVIGLARAFDREVIAEGVETPALAALLLQLGCVQGQGYGFSRPLPAEALPAWLHQFAADWAAQSAV